MTWFYATSLITINPETHAYHEFDSLIKIPCDLVKEKKTVESQFPIQICNTVLPIVTLK